MSSGPDDETDFWLGARLDANGTMTWLSGRALDYANWAPSKSFLFGECIQLTRLGRFYPEPRLKTYFWAKNSGFGCELDMDNGFICEKQAETWGE